MTLVGVPVSGAATPLVSLTAVCFDTEATSLDAKTARVIEIGAAGLVNGALDRRLEFSERANPGIAIPPESTKVHHITDAMVRDSDPFADVYRRFRIFASNHLALGYFLDFDFELLRKECERSGVPWKPMAALDIHTLVKVLNPPLPNTALDTAAQWLMLEPDGRHSGLGDARLTARLYLALLPMLRDKGIRTLGEAMAACRRVDESTAAASLRSTAPTPVAVEFAALGRVDTFPYRHRIRDVMATPPLVVDAAMTVREAIRFLAEKKASSVFVRSATEGGPEGIFTERDALRAIAAKDTAALDKTVVEFATFPLMKLRDSDYIYAAIGRMRNRAIRHLGVENDDGELVGAISQRDLLRVRADDALSLSQALSEAAGMGELAHVWRRLAEAARALLDEEVDARDIAGIVSSETCALTARAARMAEAEVKATAAPPDAMRYAVFVLGSGGRGESLLALDQDNAIVFEAPDTEAARRWLLALGARMNAILDTIGVPLCKGGVMARNPEWCLTGTEWRKRISGWLQTPDPEDLLNADIFFDAAPVHGEQALADELRADAIVAASKSASFIKLMSLKAAEVQSGIGWFGRFALDETGRIDLKRHGLMPIFSTARVLALRYQIFERATRKRFGALRGNADVPQRQLESLSEAHGIVMSAILRQQLLDIEAGVQVSNRVDPKILSALERERLKWALVQMPSVRDLLGDPVG